jgi:hypothetical protein
LAWFLQLFKLKRLGLKRAGVKQRAAKQVVIEATDNSF